MNTINFTEANARALAQSESLIRQWLPQGKLEGREYKCGSLRGEPGRSLSVNTDTGVWKDFAGDASGSDMVSLLAAIRGCGQVEAAREILGTPAETAKPAKAAAWTPQPHAPDNAPQAVHRHFRHGEPSAVWTYRDAQGRVIGYICRFDRPDGSKEILPMAWCRDANGNGAWRWQSFTKPRPLYGEPELADRPTAGVLVVEGEKACEAARLLLPDMVCITWPGGSQAVKHADWHPLAGRRVLVWPDNDAPGIKAAKAVHAALRGIAASCRVINPPEGPNDGWDAADAADEGWTTERVMEWLRADKARSDAAPARPSEDGTDYTPEQPEPDVPAPDAADMPFAILGHDSGDYYYMPHASLQVTRLSAGSHTKLNLLALAPLNYWETYYPSGKGSVNWDAAANSLMQQAHRTLFDASNIRGRGAWLDGGQSICHVGDRLYVDTIETKIKDYKSPTGRIYQQGRRLDVQHGDPASNREAAKLIELCESMSWRYPLDGKFFAGWLMVAPICGALEWRPHVWLNGPSGSGKTWLISNVVHSLIGNGALYVNASTTEPGIRQQLGSDALPVIFDEAESEDRDDQQRMKRILILARQASRESEGRIVKGTASGASQSYHIRSSFLFSSIGVAAHQRADMSRITPLELVKRTGPDYYTKWKHSQALWDGCVKRPDWCQSMRARSLSLMRVIAANAATFARAAVAHLGQQRDADQIGALLAGAYACTKTTEICEQQAADWCAKQDWSAFRPTEADADETRCLAHLMDSHVTVDIEPVPVDSDDGARKEFPEHRRGTDTLKPHRTTIGDLMETLRREPHRTDLARVLRHRGIMWHQRHAAVDISDSHQELARIYAETPWARKWRNQFSRLPGAVASGQRFSGVSHRCVRVPLAAIFPPDADTDSDA